MKDKPKIIIVGDDPRIIPEDLVIKLKEDYIVNTINDIKNNNQLGNVKKNVQIQIAEIQYEVSSPGIPQVSKKTSRDHRKHPVTFNKSNKQKHRLRSKHQKNRSISKLTK